MGRIRDEFLLAVPGFLYRFDRHTGHEYADQEEQSHDDQPHDTGFHNGALQIFMITCGICECEVAGAVSFCSLVEQAEFLRFFQFSGAACGGQRDRLVQFFVGQAEPVRICFQIGPIAADRYGDGAAGQTAAVALRPGSLCAAVRCARYLLLSVLLLHILLYVPDGGVFRAVIVIF